jgi:hypothetical protein
VGMSRLGLTTPLRPRSPGHLQSHRCALRLPNRDPQDNTHVEYSGRRLADEFGLSTGFAQFLGQGTGEAVPNHRFLSRAWFRSARKVYAQLFREIIGQCMDSGLTKGNKPLTGLALPEVNAPLDSLPDRPTAS